jgi:Fe-S-cluster-containing dehydrogenase component
MKKQNRREFLFTSSAIGAGILGLSSEKAQASGPKNEISEDRMGVLVDTTVCLGCRHCEWACKTAHGLPAGEHQEYSDRSVFKKQRRPSEKALTVVNEYQNPKNPIVPIDVKVQCMHCDRPACVSACIVGAFSKEEHGEVIWNGDKCIGCRYCMVACPFQVPAFEYEKAIQPHVRKCDMCHERTTKEGKLPACVEICPVEALTYGPRSELIKIARERIKRKPETYINHIFGEKEAGGTGYLYLASRKFDEIGFPKLGEKPAPGVSESIQHGIFAYFVPPVLFYSLLGGMMWLTKKKGSEGGEE